ncbi:hypothetical protein [Agarivorans sp. JK6]|uniref:hypothetical protein n=1 Tax=Agarivorans sp. JK6 TaxID=2997426 RepID=UPI0038735E75
MNHTLVGELLGFAMAESARVGDALESEDLMVPYIVSLEGGEKLLRFFEADSQAEAVEKAEFALVNIPKTTEGWAFSRDGVISASDGKKQDVFVFKVWANGMVCPLEAYQAYSTHPFKLLGTVKVLNYQQAGLYPDSSEEFSAGLNQGIHSHPIARAEWLNWCS